MLIGLVFDILIIIFIIVACLLIYSLLLMSVETKTFDIAVYRLVGLSKPGFIGLVLTQASFFVIPAVVIAFLLSVPSMYLIYGTMFGNGSASTMSVIPTFESAVQALVIGIIIPLISSIVPIRRALSKNLTDALNVQRP